MKRRTPFLENQHPRRIYREPVRRSGMGLNATHVLEKTPIFRKQQQPSIIKLYQNNPISVGVNAIQVMLPNPNRTGFRITNVGTTIIYIGLGKPVQIPSITSYDHVLPGCTSANDGTGGVLVDDIFLGACYVISNGSGGAISLVEEP